MEQVRYSIDSSDEDSAAPFAGTKYPTLARKKTLSKKAIIFSIAASVLLLLLFIYIVYLVVEDQRYQRRFHWIPCGNNAASARAAGCHYEPMQRSWIPDACYFSEPSEEYDPYSDRLWYKDENMTVPADIDRLRSGDEKLAFTKYFHDEHCLYGWRKLAIAVDKKLNMIDSKSANFHHTSHCARAIADLIVESYDSQSRPRFDNDETISPLMFLTCVPLRWR